MANFLLIPASILYLFVLSAMFVYGLNFFYLTFLTIKESKRRPVTAPELEFFPLVTIQLPVYNEMYVAERLIRAAAEIEYPAERLEIQVLDDSIDETREIVAKTVAHLKAKGVNIFHLHRTNREGFKGGALRQGTKQANGEFIALFDADFLPTREFLKKTLPHFADEKVAFVQARWGHLNRNYSILTLLQSLAIDAHFMVEQFGRSAGSFWFNFNGTAGIWRKQAIEDAGGWRGDTLTEDLDLSYRAYLREWKAIFLRDLEVPAELPVTFTAFRRQQHRWARGSLECAIKFIPIIWATDYPLRMKFQATLHLTGYGIHLLMLTVAFIYPLLLYLSQQFPDVTALFGIAFIFNATAFAPTLLFAVAQHHLGRSWKSQLPSLLFISAAGAGMMINTLRAAWQIAIKKSNIFERTPKFGITQKSQDWAKQKYNLRIDPISYVEIAFALFNLFTVVYAISVKNWFVAFYALLFSTGLLFTSTMTIFQTISGNLRRANHSKAQLPSTSS